MLGLIYEQECQLMCNCYVEMTLEQESIIKHLKNTHPDQLFAYMYFSRRQKLISESLKIYLKTVLAMTSFTAMHRLLYTPGFPESIWDQTFSAMDPGWSLNMV